MNQHEKYMQRALDISKQGIGHTHPNPMVGCVLVYNNTIIAEGYHEQYGGAHAEVNAINNVKENINWSDVVMYVTLEPCTHYGKTPPCADMIIQKGIKHVYIATTDSNAIVKGNGIAKLKASGAEVHVGLLEKEARSINKRFFTFHEQQRPYIVLKWAETQDGFISKLNFNSRNENIISSDEALRMVHWWRSEEQSIMVGYRTVINDNPNLNVRLIQGKNPTKIVLDRHLDLNINKYNLFNGSETVIIYNELKDIEDNNRIFKKISWQNKVQEICKHLYQQKIISVLVEGGEKTLSSFITQGLYDEVRIIKSKHKQFKEGIKAPLFSHKIPSEIINLQEDIIELYFNS